MYSRRSIVLSIAALPVWTTKAVGSQEREITVGRNLKPTSVGATAGDLIFEVDTERGVARYLRTVGDYTGRVLRKAKIGYRGLGVKSGQVVFKLRDPTQAAEAAQLLSQDWPEMVLTQNDGSFELTFAPYELEEIRRDIFQQALNSFRRSVQAHGIGTDGIRALGRHCILVPQPAAGKLKRKMNHSQSFSRLTFHVIDPTIDPDRSEIPKGYQVLEAQQQPNGQDRERHVVNRRIVISGYHVVDASVVIENGQPVLVMRFDVIGGWQIRHHLPEPKRPLAMVIDDQVVAVGRVEKPMERYMVLHGDFTAEQAEHLATIVPSFGYPAHLHLVDECTK